MKLRVRIGFHDDSPLSGTYVTEECEIANRPLQGGAKRFQQSIYKDVGPLIDSAATNIELLNSGVTATEDALVVSFVDYDSDTDEYPRKLAKELLSSLKEGTFRWHVSC